MTKWNARIVEQGNGLPDAGVYVGGNDGQLYHIVKIERSIHTGLAAGDGNWCRALVVDADWDDVEEDEIFPARMRR